ncbi:tyrosine-type recombinase/integrase [Paenibacillus aestuarii]|uniref:Tyrosine-type recombinase/integrase n=1 Tax=Paenibacillus aestuarii TaxID=516965 RepID=A0ABW0K490_9BACL|nr:tyrosine-type recombinase/integrase [Paenibacillus aestuarii]
MTLKKKERRVPVGARTNVQEFPRLTFDHALDLVMSAKRSEGVRDRTLIDYEKHYGYFLKWLNNAYPDVEFIGDITTGMIRDHINFMRYDAIRYEGHAYIPTEKQRVGLSDTTVNIRIRTLKAIFNQLQKDELIEGSPLNNIKTLKQDIDLTNCLTDDEVKAILAQPNQRDYVGYRDYVAIMWMLDAGLRISELLSLRISDIDFQTRFVTLPGDRSKNRRPRLIPFSPQVAKLTLNVIEENRQHFTTERIFMSSFGEPLGANQFNKRLKYYGQKAGITAAKMTAHVYRHTWAKNMILNGCDPFTLQKMGGWADIRTMRRYIQMDTSEMRNSHDLYSPANKFVKKRI